MEGRRHQQHRHSRSRAKAASFIVGGGLLIASAFIFLTVCAVRLLTVSSSASKFEASIAELTVVSLLSQKIDSAVKNDSNASNTYDRMSNIYANNFLQLQNLDGKLLPPAPSRTAHRSLPLGVDSSRNKAMDPYHSFSVFQKGMEEMNKTFKVFLYPHSHADPYANVFLPVTYDPTGNYASESYFKKALSSSHFLTQNPWEAHLFFLPFSISTLRHDHRVGVGGIPGFVKEYVERISGEYPFWNRSSGADHFYVACHSVGRTAMEKAVEVKVNAIQVVCSSSYYLRGYIPHKDIPMPQIWPRKGTPLKAHSITQRNTLAFFAGEGNSPVRQELVSTWANDSDILVYSSRISSPYSESLLSSKYCLHVKGYEVNTARIGDAMFYGCVPVIIADHYALPFTDILDWKRFSVVILSSNIPQLKAILNRISHEKYVQMQKLVMRVRKHFQWHSPPVEYDAFHMIMYELWLRRHVVRYDLQ